MNDHGQIVGLAPMGTGQAHLLLWERGKDMRDLGPVAGEWVAIDNAGQIVGTMVDPNGKEQAFLWDPNSGRQLLGLLGGISSKALAINDRGQVVGTVEPSPGVSHVFLWDRANGMRDLGPGHPCAINNAGQIIVALGGGPAGDLLLSADGGSARIKIPVSAVLHLRTVNNHGCVIGWPTVGVGDPRVMIWHSGSGAMTPTHINNADTRAFLINDANQVLSTEERYGRYRILGIVIPPYHIRCYLQDPVRGRIPFSRYIHSRPNEHFFPVDLNNKGCIVGVIGPNGAAGRRVMLLEPVPERWGRR
jgi:probable HAF family extracellular repeat protein